jgi:hypothetical protein
VCPWIDTLSPGVIEVLLSAVQINDGWKDPMIAPWGASDWLFWETTTSSTMRSRHFGQQLQYFRELVVYLERS